MSSNMSVAEMLAHLQKKIAYHKEQQDAYAKQEALFAEKRALHEAEHRKAVERFEALSAASSAAGELLADVKPAASRFASERFASEKVASGGWHWIAKLLERAIEPKEPGEVFGAKALIGEIQERWGSKLRHEIDLRSAQGTLRRWAMAGRIDVVRPGTSHHETLYTKPRKN